jgi:hypothetical protein
MIKATIPPEFLLEWFMKSLLPYISKDVSTLRVNFDEEDIFRAQQLDLIYSKSGILYEILSYALRLNIDPMKLKYRPHADGIVGSIDNIVANLVAN